MSRRQCRSRNEFSAASQTARAPSYGILLIDNFIPISRSRPTTPTCTSLQIKTASEMHGANQSINIYFTQQPIGFFKNERLCLARATGVHRKSTSAKSIGQREAPDLQGHHTRGPAEQNLEEEWQGSTTRPQPEKAPASPQAITTPHTAPTAERPPRR